MSATQTALTDAQLKDELQKNQKELGRVRERLQVEHRQLNAANTERNRLVDAVARGSAKEADVLRVKGQLEEIGIRVEGLAKLIPPLEAAIKGLDDEARRRQIVASKAAREKDKAQRFEKGRTLALRIRETLALLCTGNMRELEELRGSLVADFPDSGGVEAASALREILVSPARPSEKLRNPEVHLAQLEAAGLVPFGFYVNARMVRGTVQGEPDRQVVALSPGGAVRLTVVPMRPRE